MDEMIDIYGLFFASPSKSSRVTDKVFKAGRVFETPSVYQRHVIC